MQQNNNGKKEKYIRELSIPESHGRSDQKCQFTGDEGTKETLLRLADQAVPSSLGFTMPIKNFPDPYPELMFNQQDNQQLSNNKKKERNKQHSLKYLSFQVKNLVGIHKETTYKQMADILVSEISDQDNENQNLKRRVYDSINVMVSLGILEKNRKIITKGWMFSQNHMTSKYVGDTLERYRSQKVFFSSKQGQLQAVVKEKKAKFQHLTSQLKRIQTQERLNKELLQDGSSFLNQSACKKNKIYHFPLMIFRLPENAKLQIIFDEGKTKLSIFSDHEIKLVGDYDILPMIKRIEESKDERPFDCIRKF